MDSHEVPLTRAFVRARTILRVLWWMGAGILLAIVVAATWTRWSIDIATIEALHDVGRSNDKLIDELRELSEQISRSRRCPL